MKSKTTATLTVVATGPEADFDGFDEVPVWTVAVEDDDGEVVGKVFSVRSRAAARELMVKMGRDRGFPTHDDTMPA